MPSRSCPPSARRQTAIRARRHLFSSSIWLHIRGIDFDAHRLTDQIDGQYEPRTRRVLPHQPSDDPLQRSVYHLYHRPFTNERTGVVLQLAGDEEPNAFELVVGNRRRLALEGHDVDHAGALQDRERVFRVEFGEAVAGKQRPGDLLLPILPAAPARDRRQECFDVLPFELLADDLLVAGSRPDGEPVFRGGGHPVAAYWDGAIVGAFFWSVTPSSYAFLISGFFHSMIASDRRRSRYFRNSA